MPAGEREFLIPYRLRSVKVAVQATVLTVAGLIVYALIPGTEIAYKALYWTTLLMAAVGVAFMGALPWPRLFRTEAGLRVMYLWSGLDIVLITMLIVAVGRGHSEMFFIYALTTVFFAAAAYERLAQAILLGMTFMCYLAVQPLIPGAIEPATVLMRLVVLTGSAFMASFLSWELRRQMEAHGISSREAIHRTELLAVVASAARAMSSLDPDKVLGVVTDSVISLGFEASSLCVLDENGATYRIMQSRGVPAEYAASRHSTAQGILSIVLEKQGIVRVDDYSTFEKALPMFRDMGFKSVIAAPIWLDGKIEAVLIGGSRQQVKVELAEVEGFDLLTAQAARALENAKRFADARSTMERLEELDNLKSDFLSNMSHELRTPLTAIEGMTLTMLERWESLDEKSRLDFLKRVNANSQTLDEIITNLLDFARFESGRIEVNKVEFDVSGLAHRVVNRLEHLLQGHDLRFAAEGDLIVEGDPILIERVVENFISNAVKHTEIGTAITLAAYAEDGNLVVSVSDEGPGIPPEELAHIGDRFFRGGDTNTRSTRGVGLGIAFAKEIIELHGGTFEVRSEIGKGTEFRFLLSLSKPSEQDQKELRASI